MTVWNRILWVALALAGIVILGQGVREAASDPSWWHAGGNPCATQAGCNSNR